jgi:hypothetical protein
VKRIALVVCWLVVCAAAQGIRRQSEVLVSGGFPNATVRVCTEPATGVPCSPIATIYSDPGLTQVMSNPLTTDASGNYAYFGSNGNTYHEQITGSGLQEYDIPYITLPLSLATMVSANNNWTGINKFSQTVGITDISTGSTFESLGDSFGFCFNVATPSCWSQVFSAEKNFTVTNGAVSSTGVADQGQFGVVAALINTPPYGSYGYWGAINDMRNNLNSAQQGLWQQSFEALAWVAATPETNKQRASAVCSGSWGLAPSNYSGNLYSTTTPGATCTGTVHGTDIVIIGAYQVANSSTTNATIDGIYTTPTITTSTNAFPTVAFNNNFGPSFIHLTGLVEQDHSVTFTCVSTTSGNPCYFIMMGTSFGVGATGPFFYDLETPKLNGTCGAGCGYNLTSVNCTAPCGSDALVADFDMLEQQAMNDLHNSGLNTLFVPLNQNYTPVIGACLQADGVHPNATCSTLAGNDLIAVAKGYSTPMDRGASATFTNLNPCTANASGGGMFAVGGLGVGAGNACPVGMQRGDIAAVQFYNSGRYLFGLDGTSTGQGVLARLGSNFTFGIGGISSVTALGFVSTTTTGSAPFTVSSTTPVANLNASPVTYEISGTQDVNPHVVRGFCTLGTNCAITLVGSAIFSATANYNCYAQDETSAAATKIVRSSASVFTITGTGTDNISYQCIGF